MSSVMELFSIYFIIIFSFCLIFSRLHFVFFLLLNDKYINKLIFYTDRYVLVPMALFAQNEQRACFNLKLSTLIGFIPFFSFFLIIIMALCKSNDVLKLKLTVRIRICSNRCINDASYESNSSFFLMA